jgi:hypothetical protein
MDDLLEAGLEVLLETNGSLPVQREWMPGCAASWT